MRTATILGALILAATAASAADGTPAPTFTKDVAPIFYKSCVECHRPTMFAPMSLMTYDEARPWARSIKQRVAARTMPPWGADPPHGTFKNDPRLTEQGDRHDRRVGRRRRAEGRRQGSAAGAGSSPTAGRSASPTRSSRWRKSSRFPPTGAIPYHVLPRADAPHRRQVDSGDRDQAGRARAGAPRDRVHAAGRVSRSTPGGALGPTNIGGVTPNKPGIVFRARRRAAAARQLTTSSCRCTTRPTARRRPIARRSASSTRRSRRRSCAAGGMALQPALRHSGQRRQRRGEGVDDSCSATRSLTTLTPHMHVRGKDMTYIAHYPDGTTETLLSVPKYDFNWQITYELATPKVLPKGTEGRSHRALRQLGEQQVQSGSDEGRALGRSDVGRDDDRLLRSTVVDPAAATRSRCRRSAIKNSELGIRNARCSCRELPDS